MLCRSDCAIYVFATPMHTAEASSTLLGMTNSAGMPHFTGDGTTALLEMTSTMLEPTITPTEPSTAPGFSETGEWDRATRRMCGDFLQQHLGHRV